MIQFFALSMILAINQRLPIDCECFLKPDVDAQNAIVFEHEHGIVYWQVSVNIETNKFSVYEVHLDKNSNTEFDTTNEYDTILIVLNNIELQIKQLSGL